MSGVWCEQAWPELLTDCSSRTICLHGDRHSSTRNLPPPPQMPVFKPVSPAYGGFSIWCGKCRAWLFACQSARWFKQASPGCSFQFSHRLCMSVMGLRSRSRERRERRGEEEEQEVGKACFEGEALFGSQVRLADL